MLSNTLKRKSTPLRRIPTLPTERENSLKSYMGRRLSSPSLRLSTNRRSLREQALSTESFELI
uniref:Developmentally regulated protein n=1 Tax=Entamoeba invadens TaxID=33085 RepID=O96846_ENTIV|nr:developmentally regulated protein [Entamoeba invadens]